MHKTTQAIASFETEADAMRKAARAVARAAR